MEGAVSSVRRTDGLWAYLGHTAYGRRLEQSLTQPPGDSELFLVCERRAVLQALSAVAEAYGVLIDGWYFFWPVQDGERGCNHKIPDIFRKAFLAAQSVQQFWGYKWIR